MKVSIVHPEGEQAASTVIDALAEPDIPVIRSPHVGNVTGTNIAFITEALQLGTVQLEMVDTVSAKDASSLPRAIQTSSSTEPVISKRQATKVVSMCPLKPEASELFALYGLSVNHEHLTAADAHNNALLATLPNSVTAHTTSEFWQGLHPDVQLAGLDVIAHIYGTEVGAITPEGKYRTIGHQDIPQQLFDGATGGIVPPHAAAIGIEIVATAFQNTNGDSAIVHTSGNSMFNYTKEPEFLEEIGYVTTQLAAALGISTCTHVEYLIPKIKDVLKADAWAAAIGSSSELSDYGTQYDILRSVA